MRIFSKPVIQVLFVGAASFLLGVACLFAFLKISPETGRQLLGLEGSRYHSTKPIVPALQLAPKAEDEDAQAQAPAQPPAGARPGRGGPPLSAFFDDDDKDLLQGQNPFAAMRKMHEQLEEEMRAGFAGLGNEAALGDEITTKEDDKSVSYEIKGADRESLSTSVKNGYLTVTGETKREQGGMRFQASFHRMFSLPPGVDATKMETISEKDRVVLRFPKKAS